MRDKSYGQDKKSPLDKVIGWVRIRKIVPFIPQGAKMLDLGCGYNGELLVSLREVISEGVGMDLSVGKSRQVKLIKGRVDQVLPFSKNTFDVVSALAIIEHVEDSAMMLSEICRVLRPNGVMLITTPAKSGKIPLEIMAKIGLISREEIADHKRYYTKSSLRQAMEKAKLRQTDVKHFGLMWMNLLGKGVK